jgi:hypothetical protein
LDEVIWKHIGMEVVAEITLRSKDRDPGFRVFNAQATKALTIPCESKAWQQATPNQVSSIFAFP